jgi:adenosylcobinamide-phosphate synthase
MILLAALVLDVAVGDPRNAWHPVAWVGRGLSRLLTHAPRDGRRALLAVGAATVLGAAAAAAGIASAAARMLRPTGVVGILGQAWLLKCTFSLRGLIFAARLVQQRLRAGNLVGGRQAVGVHLVSRDTIDLDASGVVSATVESVAENLTDSIVAPVFWYLCLGLPGAWGYRVVNTVDAMVGYRTGALEYLGKVPARLDDALNWLPARVAGVAMVAGAFVAGADAAAAWRILRDHRRRPASPNAGWTMAPMAGALGVTLEKPRAYRLGTGPAPGVDDIGRSLEIMTAAAVGGIAVALALARVAVSLSSSSRRRCRRII